METMTAVRSAVALASLASLAFASGCGGAAHDTDIAGLPDPPAATDPKAPPLPAREAFDPHGPGISIRAANDVYRLSRLVFVEVAIDGKVALRRGPHDPSLASEPEMPVFDGPLAPGPHEIAVRFELVPNESPIAGYDEPLRLRGRETITIARDAGPRSFRIVLYEEDRSLAPAAGRLAIRVEQRGDEGP
jgi:hypothetical protein